MVSALGKSLAQEGQQVATVTPLYAGIREKFRTIKRTGIEFELQLGTRTVSAKVWSLEISERLTIYFIEQAEFYDRPSLYLAEDGRDYPDNAARFIFFSKCVAHLARHLPLQPEIVHLHDWQVGVVPLLLKHQELTRIWPVVPASVITIHNLAYQGVFPRAHYDLTNLPPDYFHADGVEFYGQFNCLKTGLVFADMITTVSPRYAREITTEQYGCGLDGVLRSRQPVLTGILNGVDYSEWRTDKNPFLTHTYSAENLQGKADQKAALQKELGLPIEPDVPLFGTISRLADQKGLDIQLPALEEMLASRLQFILLGSGSSEYERAFRRLAERYPRKVAVRIGYDHGLSHRIEAGCDFFLMPSKFEPCGLNQMYSLRYGTIPIVRVTGGLDDSITDLSEDLDSADGIKFYEYSPRALAKAIRKALVLYGNPDLLEHYRLNAMQVDFSWKHTSHEYLHVFERALKMKGRVPSPA